MRQEGADLEDNHLQRAPKSPFPHEKSLAFMRNVKHPREMAPRIALVYHPKDPLPLWRDSAGLFRRCGDIVFFLAPTTTVHGVLYKNR